MKTASLLTVFASALLLFGCGSNSKVIEQSGDSNALAAAQVYKIATVNFKWAPPKDWEVTGEDWKKRSEELSDTFRQEFKEEAHKQADILKMDDKPTSGVLVTCNVINMDRGGWGGTGNATAEVEMKDIASGKVLYKAKIEGNSRNAGYAGNTHWGRLKYSMINIARVAAEAAHKGFK
ncbi:hypothetical protein PLCT1_00573 [Planctomycetaceae bacterium]|nr:hypothetical protein PLCT1_00573 [Planctomycetaceae bacterium]